MKLTEFLEGLKLYPDLEEFRIISHSGIDWKVDYVEPIKDKETGKITKINFIIK